VGQHAIRNGYCSAAIRSQALRRHRRPTWRNGGYFVAWPQAIERGRIITSNAGGMLLDCRATLILLRVATCVKGRSVCIAQDLATPSYSCRRGKRVWDWRARANVAQCFSSQRHKSLNRVGDQSAQRTALVIDCDPGTPTGLRIPSLARLKFVAWRSMLG